MYSYHELDVYQRSMDFVIEVYKITHSFPRTEVYALTDQLRRSVISIPSNIAEGFDRRSRKEYLQFLQIAYSSSSEVETQLTIALRLGYFDDDQNKKIQDKLLVIRKMLHKLIVSIQSLS